MKHNDLYIEFLFFRMILVEIKMQETPKPEIATGYKRFKDDCRFQPGTKDRKKCTFTGQFRTGYNVISKRFDLHKLYILMDNFSVY